MASLSNEETDPEETNYITEAVAAHFHLVLFLTKLSFCCRFFFNFTNSLTIQKTASIDRRTFY